MWYQLQIDHCPHEEIENLTELLEEWGALSVLIKDKNDDPVLEPKPGTTPLWPEVIIEALYHNKEDINPVITKLDERYQGLSFSITEVIDQDWERMWMDNFKPLQFGQRLWICPSWQEAPEPDAINIVLDPGLAFGTGTHPTTALCLSWLDKHDLEGQQVIDYGCGSGILTIAALKLNAEHVYAVDIDDQALQASQSNADINQISENTLSLSKPEQINKPVELIIANILLTPLMELKERFHALLTENGRLIVSGILTEQAEELSQAYKDQFEAVYQDTKEEWALIEFKRL